MHLHRHFVRYPDVPLSLYMAYTKYLCGNQFGTILLSPDAFLSLFSILILFSLMTQGGSVMLPCNWASDDARFPASSITLDDFWTHQLHQIEIDVLKIDVEGFEYRVLTGGDRLFRTLPPRVVFLEYSPYNLKWVGQLERPSLVLSKLAEYGYQITSANPQWIDIPFEMPAEDILSLYHFPAVVGTYFDLVLVHPRT